MTRIFHNPMDSRQHTEVECGWAKVSSTAGEPLLQLSTYGSVQRRSQPKVSQTLQFDENQARQLLSVIHRTFPGLESDPHAL
ncbi:UNVERIFIED_CONTAM: hypothetical protein LK11_07085 [Mumia flava]